MVWMQIQISSGRSKDFKSLVLLVSYTKLGLILVWDFVYQSIFCYGMDFGTVSHWFYQNQVNICFGFGMTTIIGLMALSYLYDTRRKKHTRSVIVQRNIWSRSLKIFVHILLVAEPRRRLQKNILKLLDQILSSSIRSYGFTA